MHQLRCPACRAPPRAALSVGVPSGAYHLSQRTTQRVLQDLFSLPLSVGTMAHRERATAEALARPVADARAYIQAQHTAYRDETGWREGHARAWLWTAVTPWVTMFIVRLSRSAQVAHELLGERFGGYLVTHRWRAYTWYPAWRRQVCWAHLLRDIEAMIERGGPSQAMGEAWRAQAHQMAHWWHRVRDGPLTSGSFASYMRPICREVERWLEAGQQGEVPNTEDVCREVRKVCQALWTFVHHPGVEPTNNTAERAIRPGVLWRRPLRDPECRGLPLCGSDDDGGGNAQATTVQCPRLCHGRMQSGVTRRAGPILSANR